MKDKITQAYKVAWRWPEVYSKEPSIVWTSRALAFLVPLVLVVLVLTTGVPLLGWAATGLIATVIAFSLILMTVKMFYEEYDSVEDFTSRETRIKEFFTGFPDYTDVPLIEHGKGEWIAYGHLDPEDFLHAIETVIFRVTDDAHLADSYLGLENSVGHLYASFRNPEEGHWDEGLELCKNTTENCFPITRVTKEDT